MDGLVIIFLMGNYLCYATVEKPIVLYKSCINCDFLFIFVHRYLPFGVNGVLGGSATVFFSYIGFDSVTATAEEVTYYIVFLNKF